MPLEILGTSCGPKGTRSVFLWDICRLTPDVKTTVSPLKLYYLIELVIYNYQKLDLPHLLNFFSCSGSYICLLSCYILFICQKSVGFLSGRTGKLFCWFNSALRSTSTDVQRSRGGKWDTWEGENEGKETRTATWSGSDLVVGSVQLGWLTEAAKCLILFFVVYGKLWFKYSPAFNYFLNPVYAFQA